MYFIYLQLSFVRVVCSYCLISAATSLLLLMAAVWHFYITRNSAAQPVCPDDLETGRAFAVST
jgi:uncharacterized membrane protein